MALSKKFTFYTLPGNTSETLSGDSSTLLGLSGDSSLPTPTLTATGSNDYLIADSANPSPVYLRSSAKKGAFTTLIGNGSSTFVGGAGNDFFKITSPGDMLVGGSFGGSDTISSSYGSIDLTASTLGSEVTMVGNAVYTGLGGATLVGNAQKGVLRGGSLGGNSLVAGTASQTLIGGATVGAGIAGDTLKGNGRSYLLGGSGDNLYLINSPGDKIVQPTGIASSQILTSLASFNLTDTLNYGQGVLNVKQLVFDNTTTPTKTLTLTGNSVSTFISGSTSAPNLLTAGKDAKANLYGGNANDTLIGNGLSNLFGGEGDNLYYVLGRNNGITDIITDSGTTGQSSIVGLPQGSTPFYYDLSKANSTSVTGTVTRLSYPGAASATLIGNTLSSNTSRDTLVGGSGSNTLFAGKGGSVLIGGNKTNYLSDSLASTIYATTMQGGTLSDTYYIINNNDIILDSRGQYGGVDEVQTPLSYFNLGDTKVAGGVGVENLTYVGTESTNLIGNTLNNKISALRSSAPLGIITLNGGGGYDTLIGSDNSSNYFVVAGTASLGNKFSISGGKSNVLSDTLSILSSPRLQDTIFGSNGNSAYISNVENLLLTSPTNATIGINASASGISRVILGSGPDTVDASGYTLASGITLDASANPSIGDTLTGSNIVGTAFVYSSPQAMQSSSLRGGARVDTIALVSPDAPLIVDDSNFTSRITNIEILSVSGGSQVTVGTNAQTTGITTIAGAAGNSTFDATNYGTQITFDITKGSATDAFLLTGSSNVGTKLVASSTQLIANSTFRGGSGNDTLQFNVPITLVDAGIGTNLTSVNALQVTSNSSIVLGNNFQTTGITTVFGGVNSDTFDATGYTVPIVLNASANTTAGDSLWGPASSAGTFVFSNATAMTASTFKGGSSTSDLLFMNAATTLNDNAFSNRITGIEILSLTGSSSVTLSSSASASSIRNVSAGTGNTSVSLVSGGPSNITFNGGAGNDFLALPLATLGGASTNASFSGGLGMDTLAITSAGNLNDNFSRISGVEVLSLSGSSSATFGSAAATAGLATVIAGTTSTTFVQTQNNTQGGGAPMPMTMVGSGFNDTFSIYSSDFLNGDSLIGGAGNDTLYLASPSNLNNAFAKVSGVEVLSLTGASQVILGSSGQAAGIASIYGGNATNLIDASAYTSSASLLGGASTVPSAFFGGKATDSIIGGSGADTFRGYSGLATTNTANDTFRGGAGADLFIMAVAGDTNNAYGRGATNTAYIPDFTSGLGGDKIQLYNFGASSADYSTLVSGSNLSIYHTATQNTANLVAVLNNSGTFTWGNNATFI